MFVSSLVCIKCGKEFSPELKYNCTKCGGILDVRYDYDSIADSLDLRRIRTEIPGLWKYQELLPINSPNMAVSLGEGSTPLHKCGRLGEVLGLSNLYIKDETRNPTGSFKDRPIAVAITKAREFEAESVTTSSSGNAGVSLSAYSARAGMRCTVFAPARTPKTKLMLIAVYGSRTVLVNGTCSDTFQRAKEASTRYGWYNATSTFMNPYQVEGDKTVAYELCYDMNWGVPDLVIVPISAGPLLVGCLKGFEELQLLGYCKSGPRMVGVQAEGCAPISRAFEEGKNDVEPWIKPETIVSAIADPLIGYPQDGTYTLKRIRESHGIADACTDKETLSALKLLAKKEGIFSEPAGATSIAIAKRLLDEGRIDRDETVVSIVTGTGLKDMQMFKTSDRNSLKD